MKTRELTFVPPSPPPARGRLLTAQQVADELLGGNVTAIWVRRHVPGKIRLGHSTVAWYELDVLAWVESRRASGPAA